MLLIGNFSDELLAGTRLVCNYHLESVFSISYCRFVRDPEGKFTETCGSRIPGSAQPPPFSISMEPSNFGRGLNE